MVGSIDLGRLINRSMVQPEYNVVIIVKSGGGDRYRLIGVLRKDGQGAGSIEGKASDCTRIDIVLMEDALNGIADASPNVVRGLFLQETISRG